MLNTLLHMLNLFNRAFNLIAWASSFTEETFIQSLPQNMIYLRSVYIQVLFQRFSRR